MPANGLRALNELLAARLHPTIRGVAAREHERVRSISINSGQLEITVVGALWRSVAISSLKITTGPGHKTSQTRPL
jgi:hypothetical protein